MRWITRPGWPGHLLALAAGAITPLALAPYGIWPLALLSVALFYLGLRGVTPGSALLKAAIRSPDSAACSNHSRVWMESWISP